LANVRGNANGMGVLGIVLRVNGRGKNQPEDLLVVAEQVQIETHIRPRAARLIHLVGDENPVLGEKTGELNTQHFDLIPRGARLAPLVESVGDLGEDVLAEEGKAFV